MDKKICLFPFSRIELPDDKFIPCCRAWLTDEYFKLEVGANAWNGPAAQALRTSIFDGSYKYCKTDRCGASLSSMSELDDRRKIDDHFPISEENFTAIIEKKTSLPVGPDAVCLAGDYRCNLACGSCRKEKITKIDEKIEDAIFKMDQGLDKYQNSIVNLKIAGDGEVFFSEYLREKVKTVSQNKYPKLKSIEILSNGILCNEKEFKKLLPGSLWIKNVSISIDAGNAECYNKVRGGDWELLIKNLFFISGLRQKNIINKFSLSFVVRKQNYESIPDFISLAESLNVDFVMLTPFLAWEGRMAISDYDDEAIHIYTHPLHNDLTAILERIKDKSKIHIDIKV